MRGISIHIGVNAPAAGYTLLAESEAHAWQMAELAQQAGYPAIHVLRGAEATREAVRGQIAAAARRLLAGDTLFVSFSGHGSIVRDQNGDEPDGWDETWCLADGDLVDDKLAECWKLAPADTRIVVVSESCFGSGAARWADVAAWVDVDAPPLWVDEEGGPWPEYGPDEWVARGVKPFVPSTSCISKAPEHAHGIAASMLILAGAGEGQHAQEGLYIPRLLEVWQGGVFQGSYCELHRKVRDLVSAETQQYEPQILMLGAPDLDFPEDPAFHLDLDELVTRGGPS